MKKINLFLLIILLTSLSGCGLTNETKTAVKPVANIPSINETEINTETDETSTTTTEVESGDKIFNLNIYNFFYSPKELRARVGDQITINLNSVDGLHDFTLDEFKIQSTVIDTNNKTSVTFTADKAGEFEFYSSIGEQQQLGLKGLLIVSQ